MIEYNYPTFSSLQEPTRLFKMAWQQNWMQQMPVGHNQNVNLTTPIIPEAYSALQYPNASAEQQYALQQQNWTQWQAYQQQYAQWQAQYGEQVIKFIVCFAKLRYYTSYFAVST